MHSAAFFRVEGTLLSRPALLAAAWMAGNGQHIRGRLARLGAMALTAPLALARPGQANRLGWAVLDGTSEDRLRVLGEEYWHQVLKNSVLPVGERLLREARRDGRTIVFISEHPYVIARHIQVHFGAEELVCNHLIMQDGRTTGALAAPVIGGALGGQWARAWAQQHDVDLLSSGGYGARGDDAVFLSAVGQPCAVRPDRRLRTVAQDLSWPVVDA